MNEQEGCVEFKNKSSWQRISDSPAMTERRRASIFGIMEKCFIRMNSLLVV